MLVFLKSIFLNDQMILRKNQTIRLKNKPKIKQSSSKQLFSQGDELLSNGFCLLVCLLIVLHLKEEKDDIMMKNIEEINNINKDQSSLKQLNKLINNQVQFLIRLKEQAKVFVNINKK
ncbi:hypothetical protein TTHERM_001076981 (macronuclear) [Tetrahymena thermophila SB210]|uniref:Uncharacterized protein n=1 Tax=Tetrahymena thermophila (strain SB210) TaxID=312017 RepID=W7X4D5_TETTS|nr:hypothetical protein TTHERM_001076981 [Tetrahymena thermophila SB210]EWS74175.1 hypothetical protein TTHERM_001076981 [Tetrahymena thermophila SB210]|eukprot:XP_012653296.1 hypothetical protein TTHERM_001076981 [Tetrahymena thermophila SB210]